MRTLNDHSELAALCRKLRTEAGLTQKELAEAVGFGYPQEVSQAENESLPSRFASRQRILEHFGYSVSEAYLVEPPGKG